MYQSYSIRLLFGAAILAGLGFTAIAPANAWEKGSNSDSWTKGATLNIYVDPIPGDAPEGTDAAVDEAIKEWNDAQAPFGGLKLVRGATKANADIHIIWDPKVGKVYGDWGLTGPKNDRDKKQNGFTKDTVRMRIDDADGLNARGITRLLKHELGHAEGLGHSAESDIMRWNINGKPRKAPTADDLNSKDDIKGPNDDDKAGKKAMWGTTPKQSSSNTNSSHSFNYPTRIWTYTDQLIALTGPGMTDPVTEFTMELSQGVTLSNITVTGMPTGWHYTYFDGGVDASPGDIGINDTLDPEPSLLSFQADSSSFGILPGDIGTFSFTSLLGPVESRAYTNSPNWDSDESTVFTPATTPEPSALAMFATGSLGLLGCLLRRRRK